MSIPALPPPWPTDPVADPVWIASADPEALRNALDALLCGQHEAPEEATNLTDTQWHRSPRVALKAARLLGTGWSSVFF